MKKKDINNNPFKTPEGYFDSLSDRLMDAAKHKLPNAPKDNPFEVPEGYFDSLEGRILETVKKQKKEPKVISMNRYWYVGSSIAASLLLFFGLNFNFGAANQQITFGDLAYSELESYIQMNASDMLTEDMINELNTSGSLDSAFNSDDIYSDELILEYLDADIDDLMLVDY